MDALHCATFMCAYPLNNIAACLTVNALAVARGGIYLRSAIAAYVCWILLDPSPTKGGYEWLWKLGITDMLRRSWFWRYAAQYFPVTLKATAPVPAEKGPYIFVCHPHGIIGVSPMTSFGTDGSGFHQTFPGVRVHLLGHNAIFRIPLFREWCLMHGHGSAGRDTCLYLLGRGDSIALAPGGAKESLECEPGTMRLVLQNRKGFARLALRTGAALVPVLGFGENDLYSTVQFEKHTWGRAIQERLQRRLGFAMPVFCGLSWLPLVPRRHPPTTLVGAPLWPQGAPLDPTEEQVDEFHQLYCQALRELFDTHKASYGMAHASLDLV